MNELEDLITELSILSSKLTNLTSMQRVLFCEYLDIIGKKKSLWFFQFKELQELNEKIEELNIKKEGTEKRIEMTINYIRDINNKIIVYKYEYV